MKKLTILALVILVLAALILPSAVVADGVGIHSRATFAPNDIVGQKLVCITFDDGWQNQYDNALPVLQQYGFKATFAVVTTWIGGGSGAGLCMSTAELLEMANQGMDIASHTRTHPHLPKISPANLQLEVAQSKSELQSAGFNVRTFVYPYFEFNSTVVDCVKSAGYICARSGALDNPFNPSDTSDPNAKYYIDAIEINTQNITTYKSIVDQASEHSVICLCYHSISDNTAAPTPRTPVANFSEQMRYLSENGFTIVLLPNLIQNPGIALSPASMTFSGTQGGSNPAPQTLTISNSGGGTLNWTASSNATWLNLTPASGSAPGAVTVTATTAGLSAGTYNGTITIAATGATNTPQTVPVTLTVQATSSNWLTGWSYRKQITVAGSTAGAQTNYQMKLTINRSTGSDAGSTVYVGTKCASDYKDIRFTKSDGTSLLDYWIESSNSSTAIAWLELDAIPASPGTATFNLYYGNSGATALSNIQNTFVFGDDFEDGTLDTTKWVTGGGTGGSITEASGVLTVTAGSANQKYAASITNYNNAYALHARTRLDSVTGCSSYRLAGFTKSKGSYDAKLFTAAFRWIYSNANLVALSGDGTTASYADMGVAVDTNYHISECRRYSVSGTNYDRFIIDGGSAVTGSNPSSTARYIYIQSDEHGKAIIVDWVFLRKFISAEPAWGSWGNEETAGTPPSPTIALSPASMTFSGTQGGSNPAPQTLTISNSGGGTLNWTASSNATWLNLTPASGSAPGAVTVTATTAGLSAGTYNGTITIAATGATNTPQTVPVTLTVQATSSNWLTGWSYRKQITVAGSTAGAQTNYQMKLTINRSTGSDAGSTVYVGTKCASDYKDIRFTKSDGTSLLDYWIESSNSSTAIAWLELDAIPASPGTATFNLYYGNSGATALSNIQNTFVFGDDFEDGTLDTTKWVTGGGTGGSITEASGVLTVTAGSANQKYAASITNYNNAYALHARTRLDSVTGCSSYRLAGFTKSKGSYDAKLFTAAFRWIYSNANLVALSGDGTTASYADMGVAVDTNYHISECRRYSVSGTNYDRFIIDGGSAVTGSNPSSTARYIYIQSDEHGKAIIVDWVFLRKFISAEPAWGSWGNEETQ